VSSRTALGPMAATLGRPRRLSPDLARSPSNPIGTCSSDKGSTILLVAGTDASVGSLRLPDFMGLGSSASVEMAFHLALPWPPPSWLLPAHRHPRGPPTWRPLCVLWFQPRQLPVRLASYLLWSSVIRCPQGVPPPLPVWPHPSCL
jgi:hypothetical protein